MEMIKVAEIDFRPDEKLIFSIKEFKGCKYFDVRIYFVSRDGSILPSKKGLTFKVDLLDQVIDNLVRLRHILFADCEVCNDTVKVEDINTDREGIKYCDECYKIHD